MNKMPNQKQNVLSLTSNMTANKSTNKQDIIPQVSHRVVLPACHLLNSLTSTVRPSFLTSLDKIQALYHTVSTGGLAGLPLEVRTKNKRLCLC